MRPELVVRVLMLTVIVGSPVVLNVGPASADYISDDRWVYTGESGPPRIGVCLHGTSEVSHGSGYGYERGLLLVAVDEDGMQPLPVQCGVTSSEYRTAMYLVYWKWNAVTLQWEACTNWGWFYKKGRTQSKAYSYPEGPNGPPCGKGYYGTQTVGYVWIPALLDWKPELGSTRQDGPYIWSGYHWFSGGIAANGFADTDPPPPPELVPSPVGFDLIPPLPGNLPNEAYPPDPPSPV